MRAQNPIFSILIAWIGMLLLACSGSPEVVAPNPPAPGPGTGPNLNLTVEKRLQVLKEAAAIVKTLGDLKSEAAQQTLVTWLKTRPEFEEAGILEGNVWAYFHDGRVAMFVPNWRGFEENDGGRIGHPAEGPRTKKATAVGRTSGQPGSNNVKMFFGLGGAFRDYRPFLSDLFSSSETEYAVTLEEASIENLENTNDLGILYIDTHGGLGLKKPRSENRTLFGLWTTDTTSLSNDTLYAADLNSNYLVYMLAENDRNVYEWHYAITDQFVRNHAYMNLAENAVVYIDACNGMTSHASAFRESIINKATGGKATYIGWTNPSDGVAGEAAAGFIFDRMLGTNIDLNASGGTIGAEDPKQRPFDFAQIFDDLGNFTAGGYPLGVSRYGGKLAYQSVNITEIILTPSIEYITMKDYESLMTLKGLFGDKEGATVTVGGVAVPISTWSPNEIVCELPVTGPGSSGDVIVTINGNKSNVVPLSEWTIPLHLIKDDFGVKIEAHLELKIRADVHKYRSKPGEVPKAERPDAITLPPGSLGFPCSIGSSGTFTVGGQRLATCVKDKCTMTDTETAVNRQGVVPFSITQPGLGFSAYYKWSKDLKKIDVNVVVNIPDCGMEMELYTACEGSSPTTSSFSATTTLGIFTSKAPGLPVLEFQVDENYDIKAGDIHGMQNLPWGRCGTQGYFKHSATWPTVAPSVRPTQDTEARFATGE